MAYSGFISYSWADQRTAKRLQKALERFRIPRSLQDRNTRYGHIGRRLDPIFLDRTELSATNHLAQDIKDALEQARFLIVLCSPAAAQSQWVSIEIDYFRSLGRQAQILPVIANGEPSIFDPFSAQDGAFPEALIDPKASGRELPLAPDLREISNQGAGGDGFETAVLQVIARILDVRLPELTARHLQAERARQRTRSYVIAALTCLLGLSVAGGWTALRQKLAAELRLEQAVHSATRQVDAAAGFRDRYGVPSSVSRQLFESAETDLGAILDTLGRDAGLILERAAFHRSMAELAGDTAGSTLAAQTHLERAQADLAETQRLLERWYAPHVFRAPPAATRVLQERLALLNLQARVAVAGQSAQAETYAKEAMAVADDLRTMADQQTPEVAASLCALGGVHHQLGQRRLAELAYVRCAETSRGLWLDRQDPPSRHQLAAALIELGTLLRADPEQIALAEHPLREAVALLPEQTLNAETSNQTRLLAARSRVALADTLNLKQGDTREILSLYEAAAGHLTVLLESDVNRRDWQKMQAALDYRTSGLRVVLARGDPAELEQALAESLSEVDRGTGLLRRLVRRFEDDHDAARTLSAMLETRAELLILQWPATPPEDRAEVERRVLNALDDMQDLREAALARDPQHPVVRRDLAVAHLKQAQFRAALNHPLEETLGHFDEAARGFQSISDHPDMQPWGSFDLAMTYFDKAGVLMNASRIKQACRAISDAQVHIKDLLLHHQTTAQFVQASKVVTAAMAENCPERSPERDLP